MQRKVPVSTVAPFPRARFERFLREAKIQTKDYGLQPFRFLGTQRYVIDEIERGVSEGKTSFVILKARQLGMTTLLILLDLFWMFENQGLSVAFATHTDQSREQFRAVIDTFFTHLPASHKIRKLHHNRMLLMLKNGSQMAYLVAGTKSKESGGLGRSGAYNFAHLSEVAFWGTERDIGEIEATMSQHYPHRLQVIESTAKGYNFFEEMWRESQSSHVTGAIFVGWWRNELYAFAESDERFRMYMPEGLETKLTVLERRRARLVKEKYGVEITPQQIAWYRWQLEDKQRSDQMAMDEKFPWLAEDAFVATGSKFFTGESLTDSMRAANRLPYMPFVYRLGDDWTDTACIDIGDKRPRPREDMRIWEPADPRGVYAIGCDPAYGSSETADRSTICVCRCFADRLVQVAEFASANVLTYHCAWVLCHLCGYYRNVYCNLEITGPGTAVFTEMQHLRRQAQGLKNADGAPSELRNIFQATAYFLYKRADSMRGDLAYQTRMTHEIKHAMMCGFRDSFQLGRFQINSLALLEEMRGIVYDEGSIYAEGAKKDDRVIAAALAHEQYKRWVQPKLLALGATYAQWLKERDGQKPDQANTLTQEHINYLSRFGPTRVRIY